MIQAIIFDMDGLMVDTEPLAHQAWQKTLNLYGQTLEEATYRRMIGLRLEESSRLVKETHDVPLSSKELAALREKNMAEILEEGVPRMAGLEGLIRAVEERRLPWGVATSSRRQHALKVLEQLRLSERCAALASGDEVKRGKPAPDIYLLAARRLAVPAESCLALEDSIPGAQAAVAAGMVAVAVPGDHNPPPEEYQFADHVFNSLLEVTANLDSLLAGP